MSYYSEWQKILADAGSTTEADERIKQYYQMETSAYETILGSYPESYCGSAGELAERLGFSQDLVIFLGFLDGVNPSLAAGHNLESIDAETSIALEIDFRKLYRSMHEARADWLYGLKAWDQVLPVEERQLITREYRTSKIVHREKTGRNEPCPCGSGKKFKLCCGRGA